MPVKQKPLIGAWNCYRRVLEASKSLNAANTANNFPAALDAWEDLLTHSFRCINKMQAATPKNHHVRSDITKTLKEDDTLQYLHQARHSNEHGLGELAKGSGGFIRIEAGYGELEPVKIPTSKGELRGKVSKGGRITAQHPGLELLPVTNRGVTYDPPADKDGMIEIRVHPEAAALKMIGFLYTRLQKLQSELEGRK